MKNTFGNALCVTIFGESHGKSIGAVIDGLAPGMEINLDYISEKMALRRPAGAISTARREPDPISFESGVFEGKTTGTPLCIRIENSDTKSSDYEAMKSIARPGHADYSGYCKYEGFGDYRGGGHFSGRITAALVAAGSIVRYTLDQKDILIGSHIKEIAGISDSSFENPKEQIPLVFKSSFPLLDRSVEEAMKEEILKAKEDLDSVGGIIETAVTGLGAGLGEPFFDTAEGIISHGVFSVPAVKGIEFGEGFNLAKMRGSEANDPFGIKDGEIVTLSNNNGGINGGITNGSDIIFKTVIKPTPTIAKKQSTVDFEQKKAVELEAKGRHDPCIVHRAAVVIDSVTALALGDLLTLKYGTEWTKAI